MLLSAGAGGGGRVVSVPLSAGAGAGAGGGGFLQVILKKGVTKEDLRERLYAIFQDSGVDVWECELL